MNRVRTGLIERKGRRVGESATFCMAVGPPVVGEIRSGRIHTPHGTANCTTNP